MPEPGLALGIDIGTGSAKCVLASADGRDLLSGAVSYSCSNPRPGWAEQNPEDWWQAGCDAIHEVLCARPNLAAKIRAVAVCGQGAAAVLLDHKFSPVRPAILWLDSRSAPQAQRMNHRAGDKIAKLSGKRPAAYNVEPKLLWVMENEPAIWRRTAKVMTTTAYCTYRLCGRPVTNHSDAGILLGYDIFRRAWTEELSQLTGVPETLYCELRECGEVVGGVTAEAARRTGLREGTPVIAGGEDTSAAALAVNVTAPGAGILSLGTAGTIYASYPRPVVHPLLLSFPHVLPGQTLMGGSTICGGNGLDWIRRLLSGAAANSQELLTAAAAAGSRGRLVFLPYLSGELQPINDGFARGVFFGLDFATTPAEMARAVVEGIAFGFAQILEFSREIGEAPSRLVAIGAPARNEFFVQTISNACGLPVTVMEERGGAALGAAILAAGSAGFAGGEERMAAAHGRVLSQASPNSGKREHLMQLFAIYKDLYPRLADLFPRLEYAPGDRGAIEGA